MTMTEPQTKKDQGIFAARITGSIIGTGATLTAFYNTPFHGEVILAGLYLCALAGILVKDSEDSEDSELVKDKKFDIYHFAQTQMMLGVNNIEEYFVRKDKRMVTRMRACVSSGLLTATLLMGGYFIGRHQSNIATIVQQDQGLEIKQIIGNVTSYKKQADGTYIPLEDRLAK